MGSQGQGTFTTTVLHRGRLTLTTPKAPASMAIIVELASKALVTAVLAEAPAVRALVAPSTVAEVNVDDLRD